MTDVSLVNADGVTVFRGTQVGGGGSQPETNIFAPARLVSPPNDGNVTLSGAATIDGVAVVTGDRILLVQQDEAKEDGLWVADTTGAWTRPTDFINGTVVPNGAMFVVGYAGNTLATSLWLLNTADSSSPAIVGTDDFDNIDPIYVYNVFSINDGPAQPIGVFSYGQPGLYSPFLYDLGGDASANPSGLTLYNDGGVLKYRLPNGDIKTITVSP